MAARDLSRTMPAAKIVAISERRAAGDIETGESDEINTRTSVGSTAVINGLETETRGNNSRLYL